MITCQTPSDVQNSMLRIFSLLTYKPSDNTTHTQESSNLLACSTWDPGGSIVMPPLHQATHTLSHSRPPPLDTFFVKRRNTISMFHL